MPPAPEPATRRFTDPICDSARWASFVPRAGDTVVSTPPKSGATWVQAILAMLISGDPGVDAQLSMRAPWIDLDKRPLDEVMARLEAQTHRRQVKSHAPFDCLPWWPQLRYLAVYRHPIDVHFSFRRHRANMSFEIGLDPMPEDPHESFRHFVTEDRSHAGLATILAHYQSALDRRDREPLLRLHYTDMLADLPRAVARIATHVGIAHPPERMARIALAARFESMKANADRFAPSAGHGFWLSDRGFFDSGSCGKWQGRLTAKDLAAYDQVMDATLTPDERRWLEFGAAGRDVRAG